MALDTSAADAVARELRLHQVRTDFSDSGDPGPARVREPVRLRDLPEPEDDGAGVPAPGAAQVQGDVHGPDQDDAPVREPVRGPAGRLAIRETRARPPRPARSAHPLASVGADMTMEQVSFTAQQNSAVVTGQARRKD